MTAPWTVEPVPELRGFAVEWLEPGGVFVSKMNRLYRASTPAGKRELVGEIPTPLWSLLAARVRLAQRLLRFMAYNVLKLSNDSIFISFGRQVGVFSNGRYRSLRGLRRPCRILRRGCAVAADGTVSWGEYVPNEERGVVRVYRYRPGDDRAEVAYTFEAREIRHVHGVYWDPHSGALWCVTGDRPEECRILRTKDGFRTLETVGAGDESWRTVSLLFTPDAVYYASDAEYRANHIFRLNRSTGERTVLAEVDGPVYYTHKIGADLFFATTAELCPRQKEPVASLWHLAPGEKAARIISYTKDLFRSKVMRTLFMPGTIHFPQGPGLMGETYISGVGLRGLDNQTARLHRR